MGSPFLAILLILAYYYLSQVPWRGRSKLVKRGPRLRRSSAGLGTVLLGLTLIYRPRLVYAIEAQHRQVEDADEDDNGDPEANTRKLHRQLRQIRRGEKVETLFLHLE